MTAPDPFEVLAATAHPDTRVVRLGDRTVLRTPAQPTSRVGNAVHVVGPPPADPAATVAAALADARRRLPDPATTPTVVLRRRSGTEGGSDDGGGALGSPLDVLVLPDASATAASWPRRDDVTVGPPRDERGWHAATVLRRHAGGGSDDPAERGRGGRDELLRWWVDGRRRLVADGRARVALAERFGTPVASATLVWDPGAVVGPDAAGLAVVTDLVVHPAHRRLGIAAMPVAWLVATHLAAFPRALVAAVVPATATAAARRRGWTVHERLTALVDVDGR